MSKHMTSSPSDLYARIADALVADSALEAALLADFDGTEAERFGVTLPKPARLSRTATGFCLVYDGHTYDLGDPRAAVSGELNDAAGDGCPKGTQWEARVRPSPDHA